MTMSLRQYFASFLMFPRRQTHTCGLMYQTTGIPAFHMAFAKRMLKPG